MDNTGAKLLILITKQVYIENPLQANPFKRCNLNKSPIFL